MPHEFPVVLGRDFAGTVDAVGDGVTDLRVGDTVAGAITALDLYQGAITERIVFDTNRLARVPERRVARRGRGGGRSRGPVGS